MKTILLFSLATLTAFPLMAADPAQIQTDNAIVQKYCAVCHTDSFRNGGLSLEHFDVAHPDPGVAAMVVSKMKSDAFGAAGLPLPDKPTRDAVIAALMEKAADAGKWQLTREPDSITAGLVQPSPIAGEPDVYRLALTCRTDKHEAGMMLAWSPRVPAKELLLSASVDGGPPTIYEIDGSEKMFTGATGTFGTGATILSAAKLPLRTLTISGVFGDTPIVFSFGSLPATARQSLSACFR